MPALLYNVHHHTGEEHVYTVFPDFGDVQDNEMALHVALYEIARGDKQWGCEILTRLCEHIRTTREVKSVQWLLPQVEMALQGLCANHDTPSRPADLH
jgi:hypothetical protein